MSSMFSSLFSRDPVRDFAYEIPNESFHEFRSVSCGYTNKKVGNEKGTCFWSSAGTEGSHSLKTQITKLRTLRHPNILCYIDSLETDNLTCLVTEQCKPLSLYMQEAKLSAQQKELLVSWGLYQIMNGLRFLHNEVKLSHNSIRSSIFVTHTGDWKLGGFEKAATFSSPKSDCTGLAQLLWEIFNGFDSGWDSNQKKQPGKIPKNAHKIYARLLSQNVSIQQILEESRAPGGFLKNKFVETLLFLDEFQLKDSREKGAFFGQLKDNLEIFPKDVAKYKMLPKLIEAYEFGDAGSNVLTPLFRIGKLLEDQEYQERIVPCIVKLFSSSDRATRVKLLEKIEDFIDHLSANVVNEKIFNSLCSGFLDTNPAVRESTVKAMVFLAPKLNYNNINVELMKHLARIQGKDEESGIRTNATICLGKVGCYLSSSHREKILVSGSCRAMKDPFPPARVAGILSLTATQQYYHLNEIAHRILPAMVTLTFDPDKQVRDQAFKSVRGFLEKLEKASNDPESIPQLESQVGAGSGALNTDKVPQWASWALSAISGKFYKTTYQQPSRDQSAAPPDQSASEPVATAANEQRETGDKVTNESSDGWGEMDDDDWTREKEAETWDEDDDGDNWKGWEEEESPKIPSKPSPTLPKKPQPKPIPKSSGLKLSSKKEVKKDDDILNELLGAKVSKEDNKAKATEGNKINNKTAGWDDWGESDDNDKKSDKSDYDNEGWGNDWDVKDTKQSKPVDAKRVAAQERSAQRKEQMMQRKEKKKMGAMKLT